MTANNVSREWRAAHAALPPILARLGVAHLIVDTVLKLGIDALPAMREAYEALPVETREYWLEEQERRRKRQRERRALSRTGRKAKG